MSNVAQRILDAIQGDDTAIVALASAVARNDLDAAGDLLRARGVSLSNEELSAVVAGAAGGTGSAMTMTMTMTMT
ncbi:MAG: hypothetical protein ABI193_12450 [Minicystis sp.]